MKNANISRLGGFTLIELLVVVLIIGILAAMALPQYFKAVERSRMAEAVTLMDSVVKAQRRKFMQTNRYAESFEGLDVSPKGATGRRYFTKGDPGTGAGGNGFFITIGGINFDSARVSATREINGTGGNPLQYQYILIRFYQSDNVSCGGANAAGRELCADFCGIDTPVRECCDNGTNGWCPDPTNN
ncbi:MAG: prepilin-type N-terminal cleavage/methylation domain-containing protein [Elusimicrobiaceae bacterium]|uniref:type IV pilin protein n=1 Tax=Candidatus Avelusimicrobium faecicola TaxID=3416205 RepID=UPI002A794B51|nr:prepilin-type N-terminal cleavage/methylation domain-containing protein [Spirochaetota bacterium]MDY2940146.1 prepilin-type N-terminal cleavage/methylation domain-containing protein [Elusimicrobiaceae bacterium]